MPCNSPPSLLVIELYCSHAKLNMDVVLLVCSIQDVTVASQVSVIPGWLTCGSQGLSVW